MATNKDGHLLDSAGEVAIDFVWGNMPMQPNDVRTNLLDRTLDNHIIAETGWNGYPLYSPNDDGEFVNGVAYAVVPNLVGLTEALATDALLDAQLVKGTVTTSTSGATAGNAGTVKSQSVAAGADSIAFGTSVNIVLYSLT